MLLALNRYKLPTRKFNLCILALILTGLSLSPAISLPLEGGSFQDAKDLLRMEKIAHRIGKIGKNSNIKELRNLFEDLKNFTEQKAGRKFSLEELRQYFLENVKKLGLPIEQNLCETIFDTITNVQSKDVLIIDMPPDLIIGGIMLILSPMAYIVAYTTPVCAPIAYPVAVFLTEEGVRYCWEGLKQKSEENKQGRRKV